MTDVLTPDVCIVGGGSAGLVVASGAAQLGLSVVLIERAEMGGDCLNFGCVPSKALIAAVPRGSGALRTPAVSPAATPPQSPGTGCAFVARCPVAMPICATQPPELRQLSEAHGASCHRVAPP